MPAGIAHSFGSAENHPEKTKQSTRRLGRFALKKHHMTKFQHPVFRDENQRTATKSNQSAVHN